jgi:hypothetical protein
MTEDDASRTLVSFLISVVQRQVTKSPCINIEDNEQTKHFEQRTALMTQPVFGRLQEAAHGLTDVTKEPKPYLCIA